jgi:hypothetical protein
MLCHALAITSIQISMIQINRQPTCASPALYIHPHIMFRPKQITPMQCTPSISLCSSPTIPNPHRIRKAIMMNKRKRKLNEIVYSPESICSTTFSPVQAAHSRQVCATVEGNLIFWISSGYEIVLTYRPPDMCQATWQWKAVI